MERGWSKASPYTLAGTTIQRLKTEQIYQSPHPMTRWNLDSYSLSEWLSKVFQTVASDCESLTGFLFQKYKIAYSVVITDFENLAGIEQYA